MSKGALPFAWHDNSLKPFADVHISPLDRGYLFGDGVYEVIPYAAGRAVGLKAHLHRLRQSLAAIALELPLDDNALTGIFDQVVEANGGGHQSLYLQVSRAGDSGRNHIFPETQAASLFVMCQALKPVDERAYRNGLKAVLAEDTRWQRCDIKSISLLANVLAKQAAKEADAIEAILYRNGQVTEGAASAVACVIDGVLIAPPLDTTLLPSVTREITWALARDIEQPTRCEPLSVERLLAASEVMVMASTKDIAPIVRIDDRLIGDGKPGAVWQRLFSAFQQQKHML